MKEKFSSFSLFIQFFTLFCATSVAPFPGLGRSPPWGHGRPTRENLGTCSVPKQAGQAGRQKLQAKLRNLWHVACLHALPRNSTIIWITLLYQLFQPPTQRIPYNFKIINFSKLKMNKNGLFITLFQTYGFRQKIQLLYRVSQQVQNRLNILFWSSEMFVSEASYVYKILTK